jgi:hypothetical protein
VRSYDVCGSVAGGGRFRRKPQPFGDDGMAQEMTCIFGKADGRADPASRHGLGWLDLRLALLESTCLLESTWEKGQIPQKDRWSEW